MLRLTADGRQLFEALSASWRGMLGEALADWDEDSIERFRELFVRFAGDLERYAERTAGAAEVVVAPATGRS